MITYSCACQVEVAIGAESKLQSSNCKNIGIWKGLLECQDWSPIMFLFANCNRCIYLQTIFGEAFTVTGGNFAQHIFVKCQKSKKFFDGQNGIWRVLKTSILNIGGACFLFVLWSTVDGS